MRSIKTLLELLLDNQQFFCTGLCSWIKSLYSCGFINLGEYNLLIDYLEIHKPNLEQNKKKRLYWWPMCVLKYRVKWIEEHIKLNS